MSIAYFNYYFVLLAMLTSNSITGTSVSMPTVVAGAAGEVVPNSAIATATAIEIFPDALDFSTKGCIIALNKRELV